MDSLLSLSQLDSIEKQCHTQHISLIERAGLAVFNWIQANFNKTDTLFICLGNNKKGLYGQALILQLIENNYTFDFIYLSDDELTTDIAYPKSILEYTLPLTKFPESLDHYDLVIDALDNINNVEVVTQINSAAKYILSLDTPNGVNPFNGSITNSAINADTTLTFISDKAGLHTGDGIDYSGDVLVSNLINLSDFTIVNQTPQIKFNNIEGSDYQKLIRQRSNTNKGSYGTVAIVGGNIGMHGAIYLAGRAALMVGCGKVILAPLDPNFRLDFVTPELMFKNITDVITHIDNYDAIAIGPGFGCDDKAQAILENILDVIDDVKLVVDADALNLIAKSDILQNKFKKITNKIITPHPGEAARILGKNIGDVQNNRFQSIGEIINLLDSVVVLKGAGTLIANQNDIYINMTGNPGLSNAGQGDTLTGIITGLLAQGLDILTSARLGVYLHGLAGDRLVMKKRGYVGVLASLVADEVCQALNDLLYEDFFK